eukprot:CAMPEP_0202950820 /NCGR_PEP_ID=MMETSP1395-20130829/25859_1 /ASSEMBLY_ACC=CAM_ASM_000871 /TAXON_ID=5961 /ORGANISM="Blepharisma japonicum, Strain Stock R1072" /LENGTH=36 /DNA_ID= /DNA_START= /DNA_END= /DNA_ORIENTATION=
MAPEPLLKTPKGPYPPKSPKSLQLKLKMNLKVKTFE